MNIPKVFEGAIAKTLTTHAVLTAENRPRFRAWQSVDEDFLWTATSDRVFPLVDVRCSPERVAEDGVTLSCECSVLIGTNASDDQNHRIISELYEAISTVLAALYAQFRAGAADAERTTFDEYIADKQPDTNAVISVGGFQWGEPLSPYEDSGANFIGMNYVIHFSRSDY